jgi:hypothetical protein
MKWLLGTYTSRYNRRHKEFGHLFSGRYKALVADGSGSGYLKTACEYVHLNPVRAKLLRADQPLSDFAWTSYRHYLGAPSQRPVWLRVERLLGEWGITKDSAAGRRAFQGRTERRRQEGPGAQFRAVERGWFLGDEQFCRELLEHVSARPGPRPGVWTFSGLDISVPSGRTTAKPSPAATEEKKRPLQLLGG